MGCNVATWFERSSGVFANIQAAQKMFGNVQPRLEGWFKPVSRREVLATSKRFEPLWRGPSQVWAALKRFKPPCLPRWSNCLTLGRFKPHLEECMLPSTAINYAALFVCLVKENMTFKLTSILSSQCWIFFLLTNIARSINERCTLKYCSRIYSYWFSSPLLMRRRHYL